MWEAGLVDEVRGLSDRMGRTAARAVGYAQVRSLLLGEVDDAEAREATVIATRRLARRQMGWFGRDPRVQWLDASDPDLVPKALDLVVAAEDGRLPEQGSSRRRLGS
jgi:tRNA dimethylallyltransferase